VTHTGVSFSSAVTDEISVIFGVVNEVYSDTFTSSDNDKAYYGQFSYGGDAFGVKVGVITGNDSASASGGGDTCSGADCAVTVVDVVLTADPTDDISLWANLDYVNNSGDDYFANGQAFGIAFAGRFALTDKTGVASRIEYVTKDEDFIGSGATDDVNIFSLTGTVDHSLTDNLVVRGEIRWDHSFEDSSLAFSPAQATPNDEDQVILMAEIYYAF
jgi:hypothetical protein